MQSALTADVTARSVVVGLVVWLVVAARCLAQEPGAAESREARAALDRAVAFMGGHRLLYGMHALVVATSTRRETETGAFTVPTRTYYGFPLSVRHEIVVNERTLAIASSPDGGGTLFTEDGPLPLDDVTRFGIERTTMRNPVALLKSRLSRTFRADHLGRESIGGGEADVVRIRLHDNETIVAIDTHDGRLVEIRYRLVDKSKGARGIAVRFGDWRASGSGLVYPYSARGYEDGRTVFDMATQTVEVDPPLPESLFSAGLDRAGPSRSR